VAESVYVIGAFSTAFKKWPNKSFKQLTHEAYMGAYNDSGLPDPTAIEACWFGNCLMHRWGQPMVRGNVCFTPLVRDGLFRERAPVINVEGACATGSLALAGAYKEIRAGDADVTVAIGVEKLYDPADPSSILSEFGKGADQFDPDEWMQRYSTLAERLGLVFQPSPARSLAMDTYALQAQLHMRLHGTTAYEIATACAKSHANGSLNPRAQYQFVMTPEQVLEDRLIAPPLTGRCALLSGMAPQRPFCAQNGSCFNSRQRSGNGQSKLERYRSREASTVASTSQAFRARQQTARTRHPISRPTTSTWPRFMTPLRSARSTRLR
jgi:acetyl-CoA acetyltransferase